MRFKLYIVLLVLLTMSFGRGYSQNKGRYSRVLPSDTNIVNITVEPVEIKDSERTERFYDSLRSKSSRSTVSDLLYQSLFRRPRRDTTATGLIVDEGKIYSNFEGQIISNIYIDREEIYEGEVRGIPRYVNALHILSREKVVRRDLLFKEGDRIDAYEVVRNKQILLSRTYFADANIELRPNPDDSTLVDMYVWTKDKWTISGDGAWLGEGKTRVELYDANFLGTGNLLSVQTSFNRSTKKYKGNRFQYDIPNIMGTFYKANLTVGKDFEDVVYRARIEKNFINPTDYNAGFSFNNDDIEYYMLYADSCDFVKYRNFDVWGGKSWYLPKLRSSIFMTGRYGLSRFSRRPEVSAKVNPAFHDYDNVLLGVGLYRESFYAANMIYGFGYREYLAAGYKLELVGGYNWGEFSDNYYVGIDFKKGGLFKFGYLKGGVALGSYIDSKSGKLWRSALDADLSWFSNLYRFRRSSIRQFVSLSHTRGWKRGERNDEVLTFTEENGPRTITEWLIGTDRTVLNTETVVFTPFQPWGFRMAIFGFADIGLLGDEINIFDNKFFSTLGFGIRVKNERLVFNTIEIRLGVAVGKGGFLDNQYFRVSSEQRMLLQRFIPTYPEIVGYK